MKTIKQIADELGVSKTAVRKKITETIRTQFAETIGNTIYINETGINLIKSTFNTPNGNQNANQVSGNQTETVSDSLHQVSDSEQVYKLIDMLQKELEIKNKQIDDLNNRLEEVTAALTTAQRTIVNEQTLHAGTIQKQLTDGTQPEQKESLLKRLFKNKKD